MKIFKFIENNFQEIRCVKAFEVMRQCCLKHKPISLVCEGYRLEPRVFSPATDRPSQESSRLLTVTLNFNFQLSMERRQRIKTLGQRSWIYRYPRTFQITFTALGLGIFFSKPIYDIFFREREEPDLSEPPTTFPYRQKRKVE
ncbi:unnamed protein product [Euphydryas editha]|uniref:Uncharacterized protein n=1 Tax=Euphydryas editha TaxID=104508 RepID=A0AAU9UJB2_EUPED|nr:unnamed protein product [Euphydryas editha]